MKIYHQLGFREVWNFDVFSKYKVGDGFIFSPVNYSQDKLEKKDDKIKKISFLDPQCYFPDASPKGKLLSYDYFPQKISEKDSCCTKDFTDPITKEIAKECLKFQNNNNFEYLIIPFNAYLGNNPVTLIEKNKAKYIDPFLQEISLNYSEKETLLTLVLNVDLIRDESSRDEILEWVTGLRNITGIYLILQDERKSKQIKIKDILLGSMIFIKKLKDNDFKVILGYSNTESILYSLTMLDGITMGGYENLRKFSKDRFVHNDHIARAPIARLYSDYLLNWIPSGSINSIRQESLENFDLLFDSNEERPYNLSNEFNWHFTKPELYKHYFISFYNQAKSLSDNFEERLKQINKMIDNAINYYNTSNIPFDSNSDGEHLIIWKQVIKEYCDLREDDEIFDV